MNEEEQEILENNKLIAVFMGAKIDEDGMPYVDVESIEGSYRDYPFGNLDYNVSWDRLMPVVDKIDKTRGMKVWIYPFGCDIDAYGKNIIEIAGKPRIESVWLAVIQYINWDLTRQKH